MTCLTISCGGVRVLETECLGVHTQRHNRGNDISYTIIHRDPVRPLGKSSQQQLALELAPSWDDEASSTSGIACRLTCVYYHAPFSSALHVMASLRDRPKLKFCVLGTRIQFYPSGSEFPEANGHHKKRGRIPGDPYFYLTHTYYALVVAWRHVLRNARVANLLHYLGEALI